MTTTEHTHLAVTLAPGRFALPRLISAVHTRGWEVAHVRFDGARGCLEVTAAPERVLAVLARLVDVVAVRQADSCLPQLASALPTRTLVVRQDRGCRPVRREPASTATATLR